MVLLRNVSMFCVYGPDSDSTHQNFVGYSECSEYQLVEGGAVGV